MLPRGNASLFNINISMQDKISNEYWHMPVGIPEMNGGMRGTARLFTRRPTGDWHHQLYEFNIDYRGGHLTETLGIEAVGDKWKFAMKLVDLGDGRPLINCMDAIYPVTDRWDRNLEPCSNRAFAPPR